MKFKNIIDSLPTTEKELLAKFDEVASKRQLLSVRIEELSKQLGESFSLVLRQRKANYEPLDEDIIEKSSKNDNLINEYYKLSDTLIAIENKLRDINKES